jgi:hypothetical protein
MPLFTHSSINSNFIKYKGKIYKKTNNSINTNLNNVANVVDGTFDTEEQAVYGSGLTKDEEGTKLRPVFYCLDAPSTFVSATTSQKFNTYDLKVENKNNTNPWFGQGSNLCFSISGFQNMELNLIRGKSYRFNQFDVTNSGNILRITLDSEGLSAVNFPDQIYLGTAGVNGRFEFMIPTFAGNVYYLSSLSNRFMGIRINVDVNAETMPSDISYFNLLSSSYYVPLSTIP